MRRLLNRRTGRAGRDPLGDPPPSMSSEMDPFVGPRSLDEVTGAWNRAGELTVRRSRIPHVMSPDVAHDIAVWTRLTTRRPEVGPISTTQHRANR